MRSTLILSALALALATTSARAVTFVYEGHNGGTDSNDNGYVAGTGFGANNWTGGAEPVYQAAGLTFGALPVVGGAAGHGYYENTTRTFSSPVSINDTTVWASLLVARTSAGVNFQFLANDRYSFDTPDQDMYPTNYDGGYYGGGTSNPSNGSTFLNLIKFSNVGTTTTVQRWIYTNPANLPTSEPVANDPNAHSYKSYTTNEGAGTSLTGFAATNYNGNYMDFDELRIGSTFADAVPSNVVLVPEPASLALAGLAGMGLLGRRRRPARV